MKNDDQCIFRVRQANLSDALTVTRISAEAYTRAYLPLVGAAPKPASEDYEPRIESGTVWIVEVASEPRAVLVLEHKPDHLYIYSIAVAPEFQHGGCARALLEFADRHAAAMGLRTLRLHTNPRLERNLTLYCRNGYVEIGRRPHPSFPNEVLVDMEKTLIQ